jgi:hypothetical protein
MPRSIGLHQIAGGLVHGGPGIRTLAAPGLPGLAVR